MRKFSIYLDGIEQKLNGENGIWFTNPEGLGATLNPAMVNLRNGFFRTAAEDIIPQVPIVGTLTFKPTTLGLIALTPYDYYRVFEHSLVTAQTIEIGYTPTTNAAPTEYRIRVALNYITKTEMRGNWLSCPVSFSPLTPWYLETPVSINFEPAYGGPIVVAKINARASDVPAAIKVDITASNAVGNVYLRLDTHGTTDYKQLVALEGVILPSGGGSISYSSSYGDSHITADDGNTITDLVNILNVASDPWIRIPTGNEYDLSIIGTGLTLSDTYTLKVYSYYRSV